MGKIGTREKIAENWPRPWVPVKRVRRFNAHYGIADARGRILFLFGEHDHAVYDKILRLFGGRSYADPGRRKHRAKSAG